MFKGLFDVHSRLAKIDRNGDQLEVQVLDRLSFMRFLDLSIGDNVPDAKTIWAFKEALNRESGVEALFAEFDEFLRKNGFQAKKGQIMNFERLPIVTKTLPERFKVLPAAPRPRLPRTCLAPK